MTSVYTCRTTFDDSALEELFTQLASIPRASSLTVDASACTFALPTALLGLLTIAETRAERPTLVLPQKPELMALLGKYDFLSYATHLYTVVGPVPVPPPRESAKTLIAIHRLVRSERADTDMAALESRLTALFTDTLNITERRAVGFATSVVQYCHSVINTTMYGGWMMAQAYNYRRSNARRVIVLAICDAGVEIMSADAHGGRGTLSARWPTRQALEDAVLRKYENSSSPLSEPAFRLIRASIARLNGKLSVRSGTSRIALCPDWDDDLPLREGLAQFSGTITELVIPEQASLSE